MTDKTIGTINRLISICRDGEEFYARAAEKIEEAGLQQQFREMAKLHRDIGAELRPLVQGAGGAPAEGGTLAGKTRQLFASVKTMLASDKQSALVAELETAEEAVLDAFRKALDEPISEQARERVGARLEDIRRARERVQALRRGEAPA